MLIICLARCQLALEELAFWTIPVSPVAVIYRSLMTAHPMRLMTAQREEPKPVPEGEDGVRLCDLASSLQAPQWRKGLELIGKVLKRLHPNDQCI